MLKSFHVLSAHKNPKAIKVVKWYGQKETPVPHQASGSYMVEYWSVGQFEFEQELPRSGEG